MGKKKKPKEVKPVTAKSAFQGINTYDVGLGDLASASARKNGSSVTSSSQLGGGLQGLQDGATSGLEANLGTLGLTPTQQLQQLDAGQNSFFNLQDELNRRAAESALSDAQSRFSLSGLENSTSRGAFEAQLQNDAILRDLATRQASLEFQNNQALQNAGLQNAVIQGLANIQSVPLGLANQNLLTGLGSQDQVAMFNAQQQQQANVANAQLAASQPRGSTLGTLLGAGITAASLAAAPFTGGASLGIGSALNGLRGAFMPSRGPSLAMNPAYSGVTSQFMPRGMVVPNGGQAMQGLMGDSFLGKTYGGIG